MTQETVVIENKTGIHARPASVFVQTATKFKSKIQIEAKGKKVDAKSERHPPFEVGKDIYISSKAYGM